MKKKILLILIILILMGGFISFLELKYNFLTLNKSKYNQLRYFLNEKKYEAANELSDPLICESIDDHYFVKKAECYSHVAKNKSDPTFCSKIFNIKEYGDPGFVIGYVSIYERAINCYIDVFANTNNTKICNKYSDQRVKNYCYALAGINLLDQSICQKINDKYIKQFCLDEFYSKLALKELNFTTCLNIIDETKEIKCQTDIIDQLDDYKLCDNLPYLQEQFCFKKFAILKKDFSVCFNIKEKSDFNNFQTHQTQMIRNECFTEVAKTTQDISICEYITVDKSGILKEDKKECIQKTNNY